MPTLTAVEISRMLREIADRIVLEGGGKPPTVVEEQFGERPHAELLAETLHRAFDLIEGSVSARARKHA